ncbi:unnamed protein product [Rhizoctonia solani]|uniref:Uncharacterized protein n=2 Tax=Rhizoctonia solani TaxID=456999 RepID=A0A8H3B827_9AGAM|nr:unnamed protein product [Rhizoctonia solani]CAE6533533.1 unnamed protein product [Rhizoctonia solani]
MLHTSTGHSQHLNCRRLRAGVHDENYMRLGNVLGLRIEGFFKRRLQTRMSKSRLTMWIRRAHVLIRQMHSRVGKQIVNVTSFDVCVDSQRHNACAITSPYGGCRKGLAHRKRAAAVTNKEVVGDEDGVLTRWPVYGCLTLHFFLSTGAERLYTAFHSWSATRGVQL